MKSIITAIVCLSLLSACNNNKETQQQVDAPAKEVVEPELHTELYGNYIGNFEDAVQDNDEYIESAKINIMITQITAKGAQGRSVVKGNNRPMSGKLTVSGTKYTFVMDEPGDDKHDGRFDFYIQGDSLVGTWESYDQNVKGPKKKFVLSKKPFVYNANLMLPKDWEYVDYENSKTKNEFYKNEDGSTDTIVNQYYRAASEKVYQINASKQALTEAQLKNLKKLDLEIIRNTVYARHGYSFKKKGVRQFFDQVDWYIPVSSNVDAVLSPVEKDNVALLKRFEKYAEDNYDTFGR
ncbi:serine/threonine protein kinase [Taibaiella sp. KBW10]|uniref:YARHG domain-containing protein n=1 Tax=Taibaiella sp. KBW10 TaxID=2153357 RepID=UPI000F599218|nr:YARHG domain-containing protein [Taibaiella sp. KBW10]RQO31291.1 serine/threonine protein kinase [Taibaiella sp. KBW10]